MTGVLEILAAALILAGGLIVAIAGVGLLRLPDPFTRMHAATKAGVLGSGMIMFGVGLSLGGAGAVLTAGAGVLFLLFTSPIASHALGRAAYISGAPIAPTTVADALSGVLPRNVFDIAPGRVARSAQARPSGQAATRFEGERVMSAVDIRNYQSPLREPEPAALCAITAWLVGGPCQSEASAQALALALAARARITGLSALDTDAATLRSLAPAGGAAWARWLGDQRRTRMRERASRSLAEFERLCASADRPARMRHEEQGLSALIATTAGCDLLVVPAGVDPIGEPARHGDQLAARLADAQTAPVLVVRKRPLAVRSVLVVVSDTRRCGRLAQGLIRSGLWRDARINVVAVGEARPQVAMLAAEQADLLEAHGYDVRRLPPIMLDEDHVALEEMVGRADAVVMATMSNRRGWFGAVRECIHEIASDRAGLILLP
jgi:monovalent cation/proton antiporter MnhG/PhaG subunit